MGTAEEDVLHSVSRFVLHSVLDFSVHKLGDFFETIRTKM